MKNLTKVFACTATLFLLGACSSSKVQDEAIDKLEAGIKKTAELKSFDYKAIMKAEAYDVEVSLYGSMDLKEDPLLSMFLDMSTQGTKMDKFMEVYMKDENLYMSMLGQKQKQVIPAIPNISFDANTLDIDKEEMKKSFSEATIEGNTLHLVVDKKILETSKDKVDTMASEVGTVDEIKNITLDIILTDDLIEKMEVTVGGTVEGKPLVIEIDMTLSNLNAVESIEFPNDLQSYPEAEESTFPGLTE